MDTKNRNMQKVVLIFLALTVVSCATQKKTSDNVLRIREGNINLQAYSPFAKKTKAVLLDTISTLKLETDLPLLNGATALYPVYSAFAQAVYPKKKYNWYGGEVACNNTIRAYENLINKTADIIFVAPPSKKQLEEAEKAGVNFRYTPIGKEAFVFFVNSQNPVSDLTIEQLQAIYSSEITNWKELGGNDEAIRPFQRNENSGSQTAFLHFMQDNTIIEPPTENVHYIM
jgi:phosphate transport system substrate-binding protein